MEVKEGEDPYVDKFEEQHLAKKQRVVKNKLQQVKNLVRCADAAVGPRCPPAHKYLVLGGCVQERADPEASRVPTGIPVDAENPKRKKGMKKAKSALRMAQHSTASMGKVRRLQPPRQRPRAPVPVVAPTAVRASS